MIMVMINNKKTITLDSKERDVFSVSLKVMKNQNQTNTHHNLLLLPQELNNLKKEIEILSRQDVYVFLFGVIYSRVCKVSLASFFYFL